ncbi:hypothetical protein [Kiloniella sp. b19]|uniref:hypothetical protein n=1 Tax=Kiloniella sp. GXU_MW_B19 TaxID=3141326 RepID=UPI0031DE7AFB
MGIFSRYEVRNDPVVSFIGDVIDAGELRKTDPHYAVLQPGGLIRSFSVWSRFLIREAPGYKQSHSGIIEDCGNRVLSCDKPRNRSSLLLLWPF